MMELCEINTLKINMLKGPYLNSEYIGIFLIVKTQQSNLKT